MDQANKLAEVPSNGNSGGVTPAPDPASPPTQTIAQPGSAEEKEPTATPELPPQPWHLFLRSAKPQDVKDRFVREVGEILKNETVHEYCCLGLLEPEDSIHTADLDSIFDALSALNPNHERNVLLFLLCRGGSIEPAYQISKICKAFSKERFVVAVPRQAKSAATLIALGADEIHMGPLGQLGPIDPQLGGLPALGVSQALRTIASVAQEHPGSAEMFCPLPSTCPYS
ncbi:MAG TPA: hypothetical protein VEG68_00070 [Terriglobales bacterium]|nr:hypothetical protein [Terriglobales bacterium]